MRAPIATLVLLSIMTFAVGLGRQALSDGDEGYYAEASREMVESGDWLTPHFNYVDRWQKPILYYWVTAATFRATGTSEWGARAFSAASGILLVLLTYAIGRRLLERDDAAWVGAAIVATCYGYFALARLALPDLPLALFATASIWLWLEERPALAGLAAALGFLDKGPLALLLPAIILLPIAWREHRWPSASPQGRVRLDPGSFARAAGVFVIVAAPWYAAMLLEHGRAYFQSFFIGDNLERFATDRFNSPRALWFYVPIVIFGVFPWTVYLLVLPWRRLGELWKRTSSLSVNEWRLIIWTAAPLIFFTISIGKQPRYILPVLPPLALLLGASVAKHVRQAERSSDGDRGLAIATWTTASIYFALAALLFRAGPVLINAVPLLTLLGVGALIVCGLTLVWTAASTRWSALPQRLALTSVVVLLVVQFGALAGARPEAVEVIAQLVKDNRPGGERVATFGTMERNLGFYTGMPHVQLFDDRQAIDFLGSSDRVLLVARAQDVARLQATLHAPIQALGSVNYIDPATIRVATLLSPEPALAITDVMVVANR